jgi:riboflavin kinase/FMN adenylyltransferase
MKIISDWQNAPPLEESRVVMTIGTFDGLHLGHRFLLKEVIKKAKLKDASSLLLTFEPHPLSVISPNSAPQVLTTFRQKAELLGESGLDILGCVRFTESISLMRAEDFLNEIVSSKANLVEIMIGSDFRFGRNAEGHVELLSDWAKHRGVILEIAPLQVAPTGETLSSSHVRGLIRIGLVEAAAKILGGNYKIDGKVITGAKRGGTLGFPTANLGEVNQLIPGPGVYAVRAHLRGKVYPAMTSVGNNPTFKNRNLTVETFLFDFSDNFYGEDLGLEFVSRIRDMIRFDSPESLAGQLNKDEKKARAVLGVPKR